MSSNQSTNKYSVLMSVYKNDNPDYLKTAIESMLNQSIKPEQFVLVEDGPISDDLESVVRYYEKNQSLFTIIRIEKNRGLGNALNEGLKHCRNELVARMDSDDISINVRCEKQLQRFSEVLDLCILGTQISEFIDSTDNIVSHRYVPVDYYSITKFARRRSPFNHPTVMFKKSVILELGGYPTLNRKEDLGLFIKAVLDGYYSENLKESLLFYRTSEENQKRRRTWINCKEYIQVMYLFYKDKKINLIDYLYVLFGQITMFIAPRCIINILNKKFLRD